MRREFSVETLKDVPALPGVYLFNDVKKKLLYVGKAVNLKNRLRNYLQKNLPSERIRRMVSRIHSFEFIVTQTEVEALLLENSLIKNNKPIYNVLLRDDKTYPYIKITDEPFPRAILVRRKTGGGKTFGPFPSTRAARVAIKQLHRYFKIRNCDYDLERKAVEPCLQYHLKRCDAPCDKKVSIEAYSKGVEQAIMFLKGENDALIELLQKDMFKASQNLAFERAAQFRDLIGLVSKVRHHQKVVKLPDQKIDVIGISQGKEQVSLIILTVRSGMVSRSKQFLIEIQDDVYEDLISHLSHYYLEHVDPPQELILKDTFHFELLQEVLSHSRQGMICLKEPQKGYKKQLLAMAEENARLHLVNDVPESVRRLGDILSDVLGQDVDPTSIEGFDISHVQGKYTVASMVSFSNGKPNKKNYRKFKIETVSGPDDFASMEEVVHRRYSRLLNENKELPGLILIDGGLGQLHAAHKSLSKLGLENRPVISLAKKEELVFHLLSSEPIRLAHSDPALQLLQRVRDESHRFGVSYHRKRRSKGMLKSKLEDIPGLGPIRIKKLMHLFGSVKRIEEASLEQLVQALGTKTGRETYRQLRGK